MGGWVRLLGMVVAVFVIVLVPGWSFDFFIVVTGATLLYMAALDYFADLNPRRREVERKMKSIVLWGCIAGLAIALFTAVSLKNLENEGVVDARVVETCGDDRTGYVSTR